MKFSKRKFSKRQKTEICFYGTIGSVSIFYSIWGIISLGQEKASEWLIPLGIALVMIMFFGLSFFKVWKNIDIYISKNTSRKNDDFSDDY
jgi:hypothetical protein